jgi:hypothetical protein
MRQLTVFLLTLMLCTTASAKLYKWVDADGNVTYSQRKPVAGKAEEIKLRGVTAVSKEQARERLDDINNAADTTRKDREFKEDSSADAADRDKRLAQNCEIYRQNLRVLQNAQRVKADDGSFLDDGARATRIATTQKEIDANCR